MSPVEHLGKEADQGQLEAGLCVRVHAVVRLHYQVPSDDEVFQNRKYLIRVLGICDILVRIRIRGSVPLTN